MKTPIETLLEKITPLPLKIVKVSPKMYHLQCEDTTQVVCEVHDEHIDKTGHANAAYLVHCANNFPKLLEALEACCAEIDRIKLSQDGFTEEQLTDHALVDMTAHDAAVEALTQSREVEP